MFVALQDAGFRGAEGCGFNQGNHDAAPGPARMTLQVEQHPHALMTAARSSALCYSAQLQNLCRATQACLGHSTRLEYVHFSKHFCDGVGHAEACATRTMQPTRVQGYACRLP